MFLFSLKSALLLALLYVPYVLLLHREAFFRFNRAVLLAIMVLALTLPLVNVAPLSFDDVPAVSSVQTRLIDLGVPIEAAPAEAAALALPQRETASFWLLFTWVYALVAAGLLVSRLWGFVRLRRIVRHSTIEHLHRDGLHIYIHAGEAAPFSWGRSIVVGQKDYEAHGREILLHETGHIRLHHSADVVLLTLCEMLQWFNPLVWMMGRSLTDLHEYEADAYVLRHGVDALTYQRLLLQRVAGRSGLTLVQSFVGSLTRRRILMMHAASVAEAVGWRRLRALYVLPVLLLAAGEGVSGRLAPPSWSMTPRLRLSPPSPRPRMMGLLANPSPSLSPLLRRKEPCLRQRQLTKRPLPPQPTGPPPLWRRRR